MFRFQHLVATAGIATLALAFASKATTQTSFPTTTNKPASQLSKNDSQRYIVKFSAPQNRVNADNSGIDNTAYLSPSMARTQRNKSLESSQDTLNRVLDDEAAIIATLPMLNAVSVDLTKQQVEALQNTDNIDFIEPDYLRTFQGEIQPYGVAQIQADQLSDSNTGNITICIADTGYELSHEDLPASANVSGEVSNTLTTEVDLGEWYEDTYGHGTHMAGTIAALGNNGVGISGVNPSGNINLHIVKVIHNPNWWPVYSSDLIAAVNACVDAGANIINLSIGGTGASQAEEQAMQAAYDAGAIVVAASGKMGTSDYFYPASYDSVISTAAVDANETAWMFSHQNDQIEVAAAGVNVKSTMRNNGYASWNGTSVATAYVSGGLGLLWSQHPECSNADIRNIMRLTAKDLGTSGRDDLYGYGVLQVKAASELIANAGCDGIVNAAPEISGTPSISVSVGDLYQFTPTATDADNDPLSFTLNNPPAWIQFDSVTGKISGIPSSADIGTNTNLLLSVSDGESTVALTAFSITVVPSQYTEWQNEGVPTSFTEWLPPLAAQTQAFEQSRHYHQNQVRWEQKQLLDPTTLTLVNNGDPIRHEREETLIEARQISVEFSDWNNEGSVYSCSTWLPIVSDIDVYTPFVQSRNCQQDQAREHHLTTSGQILASLQQQQTITTTEQQAAVGTKRNWQPTDSTFTEWANQGSPAYKEWTPAISNQEENFEQIRNIEQPQTRVEQRWQVDTISGETAKVGEPISEERTHTSTESRAITLTFSEWEDIGTIDYCTLWHPSEYQVAVGDLFTQNRACEQQQQRTIEYYFLTEKLGNSVDKQVTYKGESQVTAGKGITPAPPPAEHAYCVPIIGYMLW